jgi:hypothetical protein
VPKEDLQREVGPRRSGADDEVDAGMDSGHQAGRWNRGMELENTRTAILKAYIEDKVQEEIEL